MTVPIRSIAGGGAVATLAAGSTLSAMVQATTPVLDTNIVGQLERLGLVGVLILAVIILWRKLDSKDTVGTEFQMTMAKAVATNSEMMRLMSASMDDLKESIDKLVTVRETLIGTDAHRRKP